MECHHINGNRFDNRRENLCWVCKNCHKAISLTQKHGRPANVSYAKSRGELIRENKVDSNNMTEVVRDTVDYNDGSPQMQVNNMCELEWRNYCEAILRAQGLIAKSEAIYGGAERVGCNPTTTYRYYKKWTSEEGPALERKDSVSKKTIVYWRNIPSDLLEVKKNDLV